MEGGQEELFIAEFVENTQEHLRTIESDLLELEQGNFQILHELLRSIVSVHATSEIIGIAIVEETARNLVRYLKIVRDYHLRIDSELITLLVTFCARA